MFLFSVISDFERDKLNFNIMLVAKGDEAALEEIYMTVSGRLFSVAFGLLRNRQLAEDVLHDSFIKIVRYAGYYRANSNGYAWLCKIVRNTALNKIKSEKIRRAEDIDSIFDLSDNKDLFNDDIVAKEIRDALKSLESKEKTVIWLKYYNEMTVREIAGEMKMAKSTAQDLIKAAEGKLRKLLK